MTLGEKIQYYRKKSNISQEELGNQLSVSRQSVSMWEKDITVPTVDNIKRLAAIFSVSTDELMSDGNIEEKNSEIIYSFNSREIQKVKCASVAPMSLVTAALGLFALIALVSISTNTDNSAGAIFGMAVTAFLFMLFYTLNIKKTFDKMKSRCNEVVYKIEFLDDRLHLKVYHNNKPDLFKAVRYNDIIRIYCIDNVYLVQSQGLTFMVNRNSLPLGCPFLSLLNRPNIKVSHRRMTDGLGVAGTVLFIATLLSLFIGMGIMSAVLAFVQVSGFEFVDYTWVLYFALPVPVASIVLGIVLKNKQRPYKKNIIAGVIFAALLLLYGSFWLFF